MLIELCVWCELIRVFGCLVKSMILTFTGANIHAGQKSSLPKFLAYARGCKP